LRVVESTMSRASTNITKSPTNQHGWKLIGARKNECTWKRFVGAAGGEVWYNYKVAARSEDVNGKTKRESFAVEVRLKWRRRAK